MKQENLSGAQGPSRGRPRVGHHRGSHGPWVEWTADQRSPQGSFVGGPCSSARHCSFTATDPRRSPPRRPSSA